MEPGSTPTVVHASPHTAAASGHTSGVSPTSTTPAPVTPMGTNPPGSDSQPMATPGPYIPAMSDGPGSANPKSGGGRKKEPTTSEMLDSLKETVTSLGGQLEEVCPITPTNEAVSYRRFTFDVGDTSCYCYWHYGHLAV